METVRDDLARTVGAGWGSATVGGAWTEAGLSGGTTTVSPADGGRGLLTMTGAGAGTVHQRLAAATPILDQIVAVAYRVTVLGSTHTLRVLARVDPASVITAPTGDYVEVVIVPDGSMTVTIGTMAAGVASPIGSASLPAGTYIAGRMWRLEMEIVGQEPAAPTEIRVRTWDLIQDPPDQADGWMLFEAAALAVDTLTYDGASLADPVDTPTGPQIAGVYQITLARAAPASAVTTAWEIGDVYVTDPVRPTFSWVYFGGGGSNAVTITPVDTGDPVARLMDFGDGVTATGPGPYDHTYGLIGYWTATYTVTTRWGTDWYDADGIVAAYQLDPVPTLPGQPVVLPIVTIEGVQYCEIFSASWHRGSTFWIDGLVGNTGTFNLRGRVPISKGARINVALPDAEGGKPLWRGYVDMVHYSLHPISAEDQTQLTAYDVAAHLGRRHIHKGRNLPEHALPARLNDLIPHRGIHYRNKYGSMTAPDRWPRLRRKAFKRDHLRQKTYLDMVRDACTASIAFAYCAEDGTITYGTWDAPDALALSIRVDLDGTLDCPSAIETDRRAEGGVINRWTVADGDVIDRDARQSIDKYGEQQYMVPDGVLTADSEFPIGIGFVDHMKHPHSAPVVTIPIRDRTQHALFADPMDIARWETRLYAIMGVAHDVTLSTYTVTLELDRNPWESWGGTVPEET